MTKERILFPIATAPKDGTKVLLWINRVSNDPYVDTVSLQYHIGFYSEHLGWWSFFTHTFHPTHWMPLPDAPEGP